MAKGKLYVLVTMDCERIRTESYRNDGTSSWEMSEQAVVGMAEVVREHGMKGTFLPTPATAAKQSALFRQIAAEGFEVGMQFHCDSFRNGEYTQVLGSYGLEQQREILSLAKADWEDAMGMTMVTYRSGYLSANDHTFPILADLGVKQSSCSKPGRYNPAVAALWYGAPVYAHRASAISRLTDGDLDLVEVPVSSHPGERFSLRSSFDPTDPRPDSNHPFAVYRQLIDAVLWEMEMLEPPVKTFTILTHNTVPYTDKNDSRTCILTGMLRYLKSREGDGWEIVPATLVDVRQALLAVTDASADGFALG
jgi:peptidoglycan/xylan/chitin deacetylase (PgdA/CDA1 family)